MPKSATGCSVGALPCCSFGYLALDWASHVHPLHGLDVTPWSPAPALGLLFLVRYGGRAAPPLALAILAADAWVRELSLPWQLAAAWRFNWLPAIGRWLTVLRRRLNSKGMFADRRGLIDWVTIAVIGTLLNSLPSLPA
jgi:two-component system sensor kinase FixL